MIAVEEEGVTCKDASGTMQRRHQDDINPAPEPTITSTQRLAGLQTDTPSIEDSVLEANNRPVRTRKPNPRYNDKEYVLY